MLIPLQSLRPIYFVGIGGIGMSGIAELCHNMGYVVRGSDKAANANTQRLSDLGISIDTRHEASNVRGACVVVLSSAISKDNPEVVAAREARIPVIQRAEMLAELMRLRKSIAISGTHGKTTTTSLVAALLEEAQMDPTIVNGGILNAHNTNARLGSGEWIVVEADESDGSFTKLSPTLSVITNIDPEHMEFYGSIEKLEETFLDFATKIPFYGLSILCWDHPRVRSLEPYLHNRRYLTYGFHDHAHIRATNIRCDVSGMIFDVEVNPAPFIGLEGNVTPLVTRFKDLFLPMVGRHNVQNALVAVAVALELGIEIEALYQALKTFRGVKRRFTYVGTSHDISVIDDYAHHPVEIRAVIDAARSLKGRILAVVQPHRYTRLSDLFHDFATCFSGCDGVIVAPVYCAGEMPIPGVDASHLVQALRQQGIPWVREIAHEEELAEAVCTFVQPGDRVLCLGAGSITQWAALLPSQIEALWETHAVTSVQKVG